MQPDSRHAKAPGLRPRIFASPQTIDARWLPIRLHAFSSTHRWRDPARQRRRIATIPFSSSLRFLLSSSAVSYHPYLPSSKIPRLDESFLSKECRSKLTPQSFITQIVRDRLVGNSVENHRGVQAHCVGVT